MTLPSIGDGCTIIYFSDRVPATVISIFGNKTFLIQEDSYVRTDDNGSSESQDYKYSENKEGRTYRVSIRKNGVCRISKQNTLVQVGYRQRFYDYTK